MFRTMTETHVVFDQLQKMEFPCIKKEKSFPHSTTSCADCPAVTLERQIFSKGILLTRKIPMKPKTELHTRQASSIMLAFLDGFRHR
jgi:hypothetical protein